MQPRSRSSVVASAVLGLVLSVTMLLGQARHVTAAVEAGLSFVQTEASVGDQVVLQAIQFDPRVACQGPPFLAPAALKITSPTDRRLTSTSASLRNGNEFPQFVMVVPPIASGNYAAYLACRGGPFMRSENTLLVRAPIPTTDTAPGSPSKDGGFVAILAAAAGLIALVAVLHRAWRREARAEIQGDEPLPDGP